MLLGAINIWFDDDKGLRSPTRDLTMYPNGPAAPVSNDGPTTPVSNDWPAALVSSDGLAALVSNNGPAAPASNNGPASPVSNDGPAALVFNDDCPTLFSSAPRTLREQIQPIAHSYEGSTALESWLRAPVDEKFDEIDPVTTSVRTSGGDEIQSVLSGTEDILSSASSHRTSHKTVAERQIATFIAGNQSLLLMFDEAMKAMQKDRFVQNFRRLLKRYYIDICEHTKNDLERETVRLLRGRGARLRIAQMVADIRNPDLGDHRLQFDEQIYLAYRKD